MATTNMYTSAELMTHYMQAETLSPDKKFEALQAADGRSLLFSIGSDDRFYLTEEVTDHETGWRRLDLTADLETEGHPEGALRAKTFAVAQWEGTRTFNVVLALSTADADLIAVASGFKTDGAGAIAGLDWQFIPFDASGREAAGLRIAEVFVFQADGPPLIVVNTVAPGKSTLERYYLDCTKAVAPNYWNLYTLPVNMAADSAQLCFGRRKGESVYGCYALGEVGGNPGLFYQQVYNPFNPTMPGTTSVLLTADDRPVALASTASAKQPAAEGDTDLFIATESGSLYVFFADNQKNNAQGLWLMKNGLFGSATSLYAYNVAGRMVVWGLNRAQQVFYTECPAERVTDPAAWSFPLPIAADVEQLAPYKNRANGGNVYFAHTGTNAVKKAMQDPVTTSWTVQDILLPVAKEASATPCDCYVTRITVCDGENIPLGDRPVSLSSPYRVPVYINERYYILDNEPIAVRTDKLGAIRVVQRVENLQGARINVRPDGADETIRINPMDKAVAKAAKLADVDELARAMVTDDRGRSVKPLVGEDVDEESLTNASASIQALLNAYAHYNTPQATGKMDSALRPRMVEPFRFGAGTKVATLAVNRTASLGDVGQAIVVAAGDLCSWLREAAAYVIHIIEDTAKGVWNFVADVAGQLYTFVIDSVEKAIAALEAVFEAIKTFVTDLIQFLKFLFDWSDIARTNAVFVNLIGMFLNDGISKVAALKGTVNESVAELIGYLNDWAGIQGGDAPVADQSLGHDVGQTDFTQVYSASNTYLQDLFVVNVARGRFVNGEPNTASVPLNTISEVLEALFDALKAAGVSCKQAAEAMYRQLIEDDRYRTMSVQQILTVVLAIVTDTILVHSAIVVDLIIDILVDLLEGILQLLTLPIWIPVVSDLLATLFDYTIDCSFLQVVCLVGALPATLIYKGLTGDAPFLEDDGFSAKLIEAPTMGSLIDKLGIGEEIDYAAGFYSFIRLPDDAKQVIFITGHLVSGVLSSVTGMLTLVEDALQLPNVPFVSPANMVCGLLQAGSYGVTSLFARPYPIQKAWVAKTATGIFYLSMGAKAIFWGLPKMTKSPVTKSALSVAGATVDLILNGLAILPVAYHYVELAQTPGNWFRSLAITDETARLTGFLSAMTRDVAKLDPEVATSTTIALTSLVLAQLNCGLQVCEAIVEIDE